MQSPQTDADVLLLGTGGTIAGVASDDPAGYRAAVLGIADLVRAAPGVERLARLQWRQVCALDSKDMDSAVWADLVAAIQAWRREHPHGGVVVTHGSDTLEETAYALHRLLPPGPPVVLTASMRAATAADADGPANLLLAVRVAASAAAAGQGVLCALHGRVHGALDLAKTAPQGLDVFSSGPAGPLAVVDGDALRWLRRQQPAVAEPLPRHWPRVELVCSHAGADGAVVRALLQAGALQPPLAGLVVLGTGAGTVHQALADALEQARAAGVAVVIGSRLGALPGGDGAGLSPPKLRLWLQLELARRGRS